MSAELIQLVREAMGVVFGIFLSIPVSLGLLLALAWLRREQRVQTVTHVVEVAPAQGGEIKIV